MDPRQLAEHLRKLNDSVGVAVKNSREALAAREQVQRQNEQLKAELGNLRGAAAQQQVAMDTLQNALSRIQIERTQGDPNIQRVENTPGRRVPFDCFVEIPLAAGDSQQQQQTYTVPQNGPFVAVARYAALFSFLTFQTRSQNNIIEATFQGRSFGRQRPIASVWDLNDGQILDGQQVPFANTGSGAPYMVGTPNASPFRSMEGDFRIKFEEQGTQLVRQNIPVPSALWNKGISDPSELPALDFFPRGAVLQFTVQPTHPANPSFGNAFGFNTTNTAYPFPDAQYDAIEGIVDPAITGPDIDPVIRVPNATLVIGYWGYIISQPAGAGPY